MLEEVARNNRDHFKLLYVFLTFDQPLFFKARQILAGIDPANDPHFLGTIRLGLGGFHTSMSYLGSIGYSMGGSGLK